MVLVCRSHVALRAGLKTLYTTMLYFGEGGAVAGGGQRERGTRVTIDPAFRHPSRSPTTTREIHEAQSSIDRNLRINDLSTPSAHTHFTLRL